MLKAIRHDFRRCGPTVRVCVREAILNPAVWAVVGYRVRRWVAVSMPRPVRWLLAPVTIPLQVGSEIFTGVQLSVAAEIGPGLCLPHSGTIVVGSGSRIGANCTLAHNVTLGHAGGGRRGGGNPVVGDRVYIGPGAMILGPITVGDDALIGAGAVVVKPVPPAGVVVGNPARLIARTGSFTLVEYPGMDTDPVRIAALAALSPADRT